jgi:hypothetical protein
MRQRGLTQIVLDPMESAANTCGARVAPFRSLPADRPNASLEFGWKPTSFEAEGTNVASIPPAMLVGCWRLLFLWKPEA